MGNYQELIFYQKARQVAKAVDVLVKSWTKTTQAQEIARQLFRSATSVGANIAEGHGRKRPTEYLRFLRIARPSLMQLQTQILIAEELGLLCVPPETHSLVAETDRALQGPINSLRRKQVHSTAT